MKKRVVVLSANVLMWVGVIGIVAGFFVDYSAVLYAAFDTAVTAGIALNLWNAYCPHCGKFGLYPNPFSKNAGYCKRCGLLVEYEKR